MSDSPFIKFESVSKVYSTANGRIKALDNIDLDINEGEFISVVGPSGCGKSTLLMLLAGLMPTTTGNISINDRKVVEPYTDLGIVFQRDLLLNSRTVLNNVLLQSEIRRLNRSEYEPRAMDLLKRVGLEDFASHYPKALSGGMRQRVSICRALVHDPPLLLMDEPFGALDALTRDQMSLDLQRIWGEKRKTVLFVTHSISEAVFLSDTVLVMSARPGRIIDMIRIELQRPRRLSVRDSAEFGEYSHQIRSIFQAQGILGDE